MNNVQQFISARRYGDKRIVLLNGKILGATGKPGTGLNRYGEAEEIAINSRDEIFVADKVNDVVQKLVRK